jgi:hypothetical protein
MPIFTFQKKKKTTTGMLDKYERGGGEEGRNEGRI